MAAVALLFFFQKRELGATFDLRDNSVATEGSSAPFEPAEEPKFAASEPASQTSAGYQGGYQSSL